MDRDQFLRNVVDRKYGVYMVNGVQQLLKATIVWECGNRLGGDGICSLS